jgi:hypothetical protein
MIKAASSISKVMVHVGASPRRLCLVSICMRKAAPRAGGHRLTALCALARRLHLVGFSFTNSCTLPASPFESASSNACARA